MSIVIETAPAGNPVSLEQAKEHCEIDADDQRHNAKLADVFIPGATGWVEQFTRRDLTERVWNYYLAGFPATRQSIMLPKAPAIEIIEITYTDLNASPEVIVMDASTYALEDGCKPGFVYLQPNEQWPQASIIQRSVKIQFRSGYATVGSPEVLAADMPAELRGAILMITCDMFEHRESQLDLQTYTNRTAEALLTPFRLWEL